LTGRLVGWLTAVAAAIMLVPAGALAAGPGNPFTPGIPQGQATIPTSSAPGTVTTLPSSSTSSGGLSSGSALGIAVGALALLMGIGFFIWRDARRRAPVRAATAGAMGTSKPGSKRPKPRKLSPAERRRRKRGRAR
jgi:hypothetical protein